jgi:hypothetical protein
MRCASFSVATITVTVVSELGAAGAIGGARAGGAPARPQAVPEQEQGERLRHEQDDCG